jgi:hypothetical protein
MPVKKQTTKKKRTVARKTKTKAKRVCKRKSVKKIVKRTAKKKTVCKKRCKPSHAFWVNNGPVLRSVKSLVEALKNDITDEQFDYHTKRDGNDFAIWIKDCLCDAECASKLKRVRTRNGAVRVLSKCKCH